MKGNRKILSLLAALSFTIVGYLELSNPERNLVLVIFSFLVAVVFLYGFFGRQLITSCSLSQINNESKDMVLGSKRKQVSKGKALKIATVTFTSIAVCFGLGFGVGKLLYHLIH